MPGPADDEWRTGDDRTVLYCYVLYCITYLAELYLAVRYGSDYAWRGFDSVFCFHTRNKDYPLGMRN